MITNWNFEPALAIAQANWGWLAAALAAGLVLGWASGGGQPAGTGVPASDENRRER